MTGVNKTEFSPKKGKENKASHHLPRASALVGSSKNNDQRNVKDSPQKDICNVLSNMKEVVDEIHSTSKKSVRPQTKVLRRPTPNLQHPVIQNDSDDSSCSDKSKDDNPKRLKTSNESPADSSSAHKTKNFIIYNKNNVEKNTKHARNSANLSGSIPNPCNSCSRSQAPERLHSHAKKDSRGLMVRRSPSLEVKITSPQKKASESKRSDIQAQERVKSNLERTNVEIFVNNRSPVLDIKMVSPQKKIALIKQKDIKDYNTNGKDANDESTLKCDHGTNRYMRLPQLKSLDDLERSCYVCHKKYPVSSLLLHESKCLEGWKKINNSLTPNLRKLPPRRPCPDSAPEESPSSEDPEGEESDPEWSEVQSQLEPCPACGRTFFPERLPVHRKVCKGSPKLLKRASSMRDKSASSSEGEDQKSAPMYVLCCNCGRSYGSWVVAMHEEQCLKRSQKGKSKMSDNVQQMEPAISPGLSSDEDVASLIELGDNAWESHLQQLVPCPLCARTFFPNRLGVHKRSCKGLSSIKRPGSNRGA